MSCVHGKMLQEEDSCLDDAALDAKVLEEMSRIAEKSSPYSPYLDNIHGHKELAEVEKVQDWAEVMRSRLKTGNMWACAPSTRRSVGLP